MIKIEIPYYVSHYNMLLYSVLYYASKHGIPLEINKKTSLKGIVVSLNNKCLFFDYSDDVFLLEDNRNYDYYFKRSLAIENNEQNIKPLNFQVNYSYKPFYLLSKFSKDLLFDRRSKIEVYRALDMFKFFNQSHHSMKCQRLSEIKKSDFPKIIFQSRLWNPDNTNSDVEKQRRILQNEFRINTCRLLTRNYPDSCVGLYPDEYAKKLASDVLLNLKDVSKNNYLLNLKDSSIAIADDGLKDTPGWKLGEYLLYGKAVISTPINVCVEDFIQNKHYIGLTNRNASNELIDNVENLLENKKYEYIAQNGLDWANNHLSIDAYFEKILKKANI